MIALAWIASVAHADPPPTITLITVDQGTDPLSRAGHAALCVIRPDLPLDRATCYNYGVTDTSHEVALTLDYLRGEATFWVVEVPWKRFMWSHVAWQDRTIWRQDLPLADADAVSLADRLRTDLRPENRSYKYHHFNDNCTSRLRDHLDRASHGALSAASDTPYPPSWREVARDRLAGEPLLLLGVELAGRPADAIPTTWQAMARPEVLRDQVERRFGVEPVLIHRRQGAPIGVGRTDLAALELVGFGAVVGASVAGVARVGPRVRRAAIVGASVLLALGGLVCVALVAVSTLAEVRHNEVLAVFFPSDVAIPWLPAPWRARYLGLRIAELTVMVGLAAIGVLIQPPWAAIGALLVLAGVALSDRITRPGASQLVVEPGPGLHTAGERDAEQDREPDGC